MKRKFKNTVRISAGLEYSSFFRMFNKEGKVPLRLGIWLGIITSALAFLELLYILIHYFRGNSVPGWASILTVISFMFGILFILIGIIGAYIGSLFETLKNRPRFLVDKTAGFQIEGD